jgi:hypothetical protein
MGFALGQKIVEKVKVLPQDTWTNKRKRQCQHIKDSAMHQ